MDKKTWGGKRTNSGRKKVGDGVLYARMPKASVERIKSLAKAENKAVGDYLQDALKLR